MQVCLEGLGVPIGVRHTNMLQAVLGSSFGHWKGPNPVVQGKAWRGDCVAHCPRMSRLCKYDSESNARKEKRQLTKNSAQLDQHSQARKLARLTQVSMTDDSLADGFCLIFWRAAVAEEVQGCKSAVIFKGHVGAMHVLRSSPDVVE
jgi:hypothetical protein